MDYGQSSRDIESNSRTTTTLANDARIVAINKEITVHPYKAIVISGTNGAVTIPNSNLNEKLSP